MKKAITKKMGPFLGLALFGAAAVVLYRQLHAYRLHDILFWIRLIAQLAGLVSQVPGGLGIFETVILLLLPAGDAAPRVLGALVVYRGIYYLLPLMVAVVALGVEELLRQRTIVTRIQSLAGSALEAVFIPLLSFTVFVAGAVLMFSGALPPIPQRLAYLKEILPLPFLELSHFLGSLAGMETCEPAPLWHRIGGLVVRFGDHFYNFHGLRAYKEKFRPVWQSRYLAAPGGLSLPRTLADTGALISGGVKGILFK